jgi:hypothetical protein
MKENNTEKQIYAIGVVPQKERVEISTIFGIIKDNLRIRS